MFGSNHKKVFPKINRKRPLSESTLNSLNIPKNGFHHSRFPTNFLKVFENRQTAVLWKNLTRTKSALVWKEKKEERNKLIRKLSSFFGVKCFLYFKFIYKWLLQHNISCALYLLLSICISSLIVVDQSQIQNL